MSAPTVASVLKRVEAEERRRAAADQKIRAEGSGFARWDPVTGWPLRPHFGSVTWIGPDKAGRPPGMRDGEVDFWAKPEVS